MTAYFDHEKIIGFYSLRFDKDGSCELNNLCVLPENRHEKIGERLLNHAFLMAGDRDCHKMTISIVEENCVLRTWYEKHGFQHTGTKKIDFFPFTYGYMEKVLS